MRIDNQYAAPVIYVKDASKSVPVVSSLLSKDNKDKFAAQVRTEYEELVASYASKSGMVKYLTLVYNKRRQESITNEMMDIVGGAEALRGT